MTLDEAIKHCKEVAENCNNSKCALEHKQLVDWLEELKRFKQSISYDILYKNSAYNIKRQKAKEYGENHLNHPKSEAMIPLSLKEAYLVGYDEGYLDALKNKLK